MIPSLKLSTAALTSWAVATTMTNPTNAWTSPAIARRPAFQRTTRLYSGPFFGPEEEFECPDEEECEIDWDLMPGFADDAEDESDVDLQPRQSFAKQALDSLDKGRVRLEMNWQMDECETDQDTCSDFCPDCAGSGRQPCRFCRGTGMIAYANDFRPCLICATAAVKGQEDCASCRGTGKIAPWASTMEDHLKK